MVWLCARTVSSSPRNPIDCASCTGGAALTSPLPSTSAAAVAAASAPSPATSVTCTAPAGATEIAQITPASSALMVFRFIFAVLLLSLLKAVRV